MGRSWDGARLPRLVWILGMAVSLVASGCSLPLIAAAKKGDAEAVERRLAAGEYANQARNGYTPLMYAALHGDLRMTQMLLDAGANLDTPNYAQDRTTALMLAAERCHVDVVQVLVSAGADIHARCTAYVLDGSGRIQSDAGGNTALTLAVRERCLEAVLILLRAGADPNMDVIWQDAGDGMRSPGDNVGRGSTISINGKLVPLKPEKRGRPLDIAGDDDAIIRALAQYGARY